MLYSITMVRPFPPHHHHSFCVEDGGCKAHRWNRSQQVCAQLSSAFCADYTIISRTVREEVAQRIVALKAKSPRFHAELAIIQAGTRPDSSVYVRMKQKAGVPVSNIIHSGRMALTVARFSGVFREQPFTLQISWSAIVRPAQVGRKFSPYVEAHIHLAEAKRQLRCCGRYSVPRTSSVASSGVPVKLWTQPPFAPTLRPPSSPKPSSRRIETKSACAERE